mgnify:CR=1 FL=1
MRFTEFAAASAADVPLWSVGLSIMGLMMLAASTGCTISVTATGAQADAAMDALDALVADKFGEEM